MTVLTPALKATIEQQLAASPVVLYMKGTPEQPMCGFSARAVTLLQRHGVPFAAYDVLQSDDLRMGLKAYADWPTFPQLYVGGELIGGADIMIEMEQSGELEPLLKSAAA